jgi:GH15 family glucan-1,4-alpha-glucosidase
MDAVYLHNKYVEPIGYDGWVRLRRLVDWLCDNWNREDEGIWEVRGGRRHFVYSKLMSWVALDRSLRLADKRSFPADRARWLKVRDDIYEEVMAKGWDPHRKVFVQAYGSDALDASSLLMPLVFFMAPSDPRMLSTLDAIRRPLAAGGLTADGLVYRYDPAATPDGLAGSEGTFNMCSFWLVEALTRAGRNPGALGGSPAAVRADAWVRQPPRLVRRADGRQRRGPGQLPAGLHPPGLDQRRFQSGPGARGPMSQPIGDKMTVTPMCPLAFGRVGHIDRHA